MLCIGVDDTDSPEGGCTTALAHLLLQRFHHLRPDGAPRLVRLNPNVPWKTRGNAAIALRFHDDADLDETLARVLALLHRHARVHPGTSPGCVVSRAPLPAALYDAAVSRIVEHAEVEHALVAADARWSGGRGVIGAAAAIAWPAQRTTWERLAYRAPERVGTPRDVEGAWAREIEWGYPTTFDSYDLVEDEPVCIPGGPDPVLWGIRGEDPAELEKASAVLGPERPHHETLFLTNQGTDDHLRDKKAADVAEYDSARVRGLVAGAPVDRNGTVLIEVDGLRAAAFPPTGSFRHVVRGLDAGDEVTVCGGVHHGPDGRLTLGIEKMLVHETAPREVGNPYCPTCGGTMKSAGHAQGYRCKACGTKDVETRLAVSRVRPGWHEVTASARRHIAMPLKRMR